MICERLSFCIDGTRLLVAEVKALATVFELELLPATRQVPSTTLVLGSIGFAGKDLRGAITLAGPPSTWGAFACPVDPSMLPDMVGELTNMVVGRFRNAMLRQGVDIAAATPTAVEGRLYDLRTPCVQHSTWRSFRSPSGDLHVRFDVTFEEGFKFAEDDAIQPLTAQLLFF